MNKVGDFRTPAEEERYEKVRARVGVASLSADRRFRERNAVAASTGSLAGLRRPKGRGYGNWSWKE